jgi:hypothetical protein
MVKATRRTTYRLPAQHPAVVDAGGRRVAAVPQGKGAVPDDVPNEATVDNTGRPSPVVVSVAFAGLALATLVASLIHHGDRLPAGPGTPAAGLTIFAVFFVAAQAIERLLEPLASLWDPKTEEKAKQASTKASDDSEVAVKAIAAHDSGASAKKEQANKALVEAAQAKAEASSSHENRKIYFWAAACSVGLLASSSLKLYFLTTVGIASPPRTLEILATGLIIGSGTKPLHDLVTLISAKSDAAKGAGSG